MANKRLSEEQLEARRRRARANYAKRNPIQKRKDSQPSQGTNKPDMPLIGSGDSSIIDLTEPSEKDTGGVDGILDMTSTPLCTGKFLSSLQPQIKLTVKQLQNILHKTAPMSTELFQLDIRMISHKKCRKKAGAGINHYMDLSFNNLRLFWYPTNKRKLPDEISLMDTFKVEYMMNVNAAHCTSLFMPLHLGRQYSLFIFQMESTKMFFDPYPFPSWSAKVQFKRWQQKIDAIFPLYKFAMTKLSGQYVKDPWFWETTVMDDGREQRDRSASGYHVLSVIDGWKGQDELVDAKDVPTLRREFLTNVLASDLNEAKEALPLDVKELAFSHNGQTKVNCSNR